MKCPKCKGNLRNMDLPVNIYDIWEYSDTYRTGWHCPYCKTRLVVTRNMEYKVILDETE